MGVFPLDFPSRSALWHPTPSILSDFCRFADAQQASGECVLLVTDLGKGEERVFPSSNPHASALLGCGASLNYSGTPMADRRNRHRRIENMSAWCVLVLEAAYLNPSGGRGSPLPFQRGRGYPSSPWSETAGARYRKGSSFDSGLGARVFRHG